MVVATLSKEQFKEVTYLVESTLSGVQQNSKSNYYASFFDRDSIQQDSKTISCSGRGQTLLFSKDRRDLVLRHYRRGGFFGKLVKIASLFLKKMRIEHLMNLSFLSICYQKVFLYPSQ